MWPPAKKIPAKNLRPHNSTCPLWETCDSSEDASCKKSKVPGPFKASAVSPGREVRSSSCRAVVQLGGVTLLDKRVGYLTPDINKKLADWRTPTPRWHGGLAGSQIEWADACKLVEGPWDTRSSTTSGQGGDDTHRPLGLDKGKHHMFFMGLIVSLLERIGESTAWTWTSIYDDQHVKMQVEDATQSQLLELCCINASISVFPLDISLIVCAVCVLSLFCRKWAAQLWTPTMDKLTSTFRLLVQRDFLINNCLNLSS